MALTPPQIEWLDELYRRHSNSVFLACVRLSGNRRQWALDRMHDAFMNMARQLEKGDAINDPARWLYRAGVNCCLMELRRERVRIQARATLAMLLRQRETGARPHAERALSAGRDLDALEQALAELPPNQRTVMVLIHVEQRTQSEVAAILGLSEGQVSKLHKRALAALRAQQWEVADGG